METVTVCRWAKADSLCVIRDGERAYRQGYCETCDANPLEIERQRQAQASPPAPPGMEHHPCVCGQTWGEHVRDMQGRAYGCTEETCRCQGYQADTSQPAEVPFEEGRR